MIFQAQPYGLRPRDREIMLAELHRGKVGIIPTDSVYAFCCLSDQKAAFESICSLKRIDPKDALMSIICKDLRQASECFIQWPTPLFRILNKNLPGPFTFILESGHRAPAFLKNKRKTLGLRIPLHPVVGDMMETIHIPMIVSSVKNEIEDMEYYSDTDKLIEEFERKVGFIVIDEIGIQEATTVVDMTGELPVILRQGGGELRE